MDEMAPNERKICKELTERMLARAICKPFCHATNDNGADSCQKINNPMDLGTVYRKLNNKMYRNVPEWIDDVETIWTNAIRSNKEGNPVYLIALEMQSWFRKQVAKQAWNNKTGIIDITNSIKELLQHINLQSR